MPAKNARFIANDFTENCISIKVLGCPFISLTASNRGACSYPQRVTTKVTQ